MKHVTSEFFRTKKKTAHCQDGQIANDNYYTLFRNISLFVRCLQHQVLGDVGDQQQGGELQESAFLTK